MFLIIFELLNLINAIPDSTTNPSTTEGKVVTVKETGDQSGSQESTDTTSANKTKDTNKDKTKETKDKTKDTKGNYKPSSNELCVQCHKLEVGCKSTTCECKCDGGNEPVKIERGITDKAVVPSSEIPCQCKDPKTGSIEANATYDPEKLPKETKEVIEKNVDLSSADKTSVAN